MSTDPSMKEKSFYQWIAKFKKYKELMISEDDKKTDILA